MYNAKMFRELPCPAIIAHRGASARAPENTMAAFELAAAEEANAIELDAQLTADDQLVVFHDVGLSRSTNGEGRVARKSIAELRELEVGGQFGPEFRGQRIPLLQDVLDLLGRKLLINVHIKSYPGARPGLVKHVCDLIRQLGLQERIFLSSFNPSDLGEAARLVPEVPRCLLAARGWLGAWARSFGFSFGGYAALHPHLSDVTPQQIRRVHRLGRRLHAWTVNDPSDMARLVAWGVDGILTDDPGSGAARLGGKVMIPFDRFEGARERIRLHTVRTPLTYDTGNDLYLKWENRQITGSFKARGALNKVLALEEWEREAGLVAASAGNHGQGVALAAKLSDACVQVFVPANAVRAKVDAIKALGGEVVFINGGWGATEQAAKEYAATEGKLFISPYNDGQIIAGQGTVALEIVEQLREQYQVDPDRIRSWIVPTGGGGLISGCGAALAAMGLQTQLVGVQPAASAFTYSLIKRGTQEGVTDGATLADGLSGEIDGTSITIPMMRALMQDILTVSEDSIERAIAHAWWIHGEKIEGSAGVAMAAVLEGAVRQRPAVVVLTGGNVDEAAFAGIIDRNREGAQA